jgi:thiamine pyrophosphokinase
MKMRSPEQSVILADGDFPHGEIPLTILRNAARIICCDGAASSLVEAGYEPYAIVGDCDSVTSSLAEKYADRLYRIEEQETNDLTKAVKWCSEHGYSDLVILGGTGKREDHTLGNISLLADYASQVNVRMVTDHGIFFPLTASGLFTAARGSQISVFSLNSATEITSKGLKYPLKAMKLTSWWQATLNETVDERFSLEFEGGPLILYIACHDPGAFSSFTRLIS